MLARLEGASLGMGFSTNLQMRPVSSMSAMPSPSTFCTSRKTMVIIARFSLWKCMRSLTLMSKILSP